MTDINKLEELAKAATPGPWQNGFDDLEGVVALGATDDGNVVCLPPENPMELSREKWTENAAYIAAANPAVILSLISTYRRMEEALRPFAAAADDLSENHWDHLDVWESPASGSINGGHLRAARQALQDQDQ